MSSSAPLIDKRQFHELMKQTEDLLQRYTDWRPWKSIEPRVELLVKHTLNEDISDPLSGHVFTKGTYLDEALAKEISQIEGLQFVKIAVEQKAGQALVAVFARLAEIVIERINQSPERNFLAFLELLGLSLRAPQPARVPLTFQLAAGSTTDALVPARTQVAATPLEGETAPVIFETERAVVVTRSQLVSVVTLDPERDRYSDHTEIVTGQANGKFTLFEGTQPIDHLLYVGNSTLFGLDIDKEIRLQVTPAEAERPWLSNVAWSYWNGTDWTPLKTAVNLVPDKNVWEVTMPAVPAIQVSTIHELKSAWLRGRLTTPLLSNELQKEDLPHIDTIRTQVEIHEDGLPLDLAFVDQFPIDPSKDFFPFGEQPKVGTTLYLAGETAFSKPDASITLHVTLTNADNDKSIPPPAKPSDDLALLWEYWDGEVEKWALLGRSGVRSSDESQHDFTDDTKSFVEDEQQVTFSCPQSLGAVEVNGERKHWIRVRIVAGNYGVDARYERVVDPETGKESYRLIPATFRPPSIRSIALSYHYMQAMAPEYVVTENDFAFQDQSQQAKLPDTPFWPFTYSEDRRPKVYLGFRRVGADVGFANRQMTLYFSVAEQLYQEGGTEALSVDEPMSVRWEYWNGKCWTPLHIRDETEAFRRRGLITFIGPPNFRASPQFKESKPLFWLRLCREEGDYRQSPEIERILTNTIWATHTQTVENESLGSSNGEPNQSFRTAKAPVLDGQQIEVRELEVPSTLERTMIETEEGQGAISAGQDRTRSAPGSEPSEVWVRWHEVVDFYSSGPRSRHYLLDRLTGEIQFGDGKRGLVPPVGKANIRAAWYQTGGGPTGNRAAKSIIQLKNAVPYVDSVTNWEAASGGSTAEALEAARERGPKLLRHRDRAVTLLDFEDLAMEASTEVARATCISAALPQENAGRVGVLIVPRSHAVKPVPSMELLERVEKYIKARVEPTVDLWIAGPEWLCVNVNAEIVPVDMARATDVRTAVIERLQAFLHPLTGGLDGKGWAFGRTPYRSDLFALIERISGVDHVRRLVIAEEGATETARFLVYSGEHVISMVGGGNLSLQENS